MAMAKARPIFIFIMTNPSSKRFGKFIAIRQAKSMNTSRRGEKRMRKALELILQIGHNSARFMAR
jgi:hypothetical protein